MQIRFRQVGRFLRNDTGKMHFVYSLRLHFKFDQASYKTKKSRRKTGLVRTMVGKST